MEHAVEIDNIKKDLRVTQDSVLLIHQDLKQMSRGITEMATSMKVMVDVQSDMRIMNERAEARHQAQKTANDLLHVRIDATNKVIQDKSEIIEKQARNGETAYGILKWAGGIIGGAMLLAALGSWVYVLALQGVK